MPAKLRKGMGLSPLARESAVRGNPGNWPSLRTHGRSTLIVRLQTNIALPRSLSGVRLAGWGSALLSDRAWTDPERSARVALPATEDSLGESHNHQRRDDAVKRRERVDKHGQLLRAAVLPFLILFAGTIAAQETLPFPTRALGGMVGPTLQESVHKWR